MSGHSKWATIKRQKGATDAKRGQLFTKLAKAITLSVQQGGGIADPDSNFKLRLAIDRARAANMPKENIERATEKGSGAKGANFDEVLYEGFGPNGIAFMVEAATDNKSRTTSEVKNIIEKNGGNLGTPGSVAYQFGHVGLITIPRSSYSLEDIFIAAIDAGAQDVEEEKDYILVYTKLEDLSRVKDVLSNSGINIESAELIRKPLVLVEVQDLAAAQKVIEFTEKLEDHDDVQKVYSNFDIPDSILTA